MAKYAHIIANHGGTKYTAQKAEPRSKQKTMGEEVRGKGTEKNRKCIQPLESFETTSKK